MKLVFGYIFKFGNIINQGFDFGSEYKYKSQLDDGVLSITRTENPKYVKNLYKNEDGFIFDNITAIVGNNASGKSNLVQCLILALRNINEAKAFFIVTDENANAKFYYIDEDYEPVAYKTNFVCTNLPSKSEYGYPRDTIFYSPIYDFRKFWEHDNSFVDISSNYLIRKDLRNGFIPLSTSEPIELHRYEEMVRQLNFINDVINNKIILKNFNVPTGVYIKILELSFPQNSVATWDKEEGYLYNTLSERINQEELEIDFIYDDQEINYNNILKDNYKKKIYYSFLRSFWFYLLSYFRINTSKGNRLIDIYNKINGTLENLNSKAFIDKFLSNQNRIDPSKVNTLLDTFRNILATSDLTERGYKYNNGGIIIPVDQAILFENAYRSYLLEVKVNKTMTQVQDIQTSDTSLPFNFIGLDWSIPISSGERNYLNLYARIYYAINSVLMAKRSIPIGDKKTYAPFLYIIIDEGDTGFHLQWQKEFVNNLISNLPNILVFAEPGKRAYYPRLQIIFTTHSPICVSDIPEYNIIYLENKSGFSHVIEDNKPRNSFGANIHDIIRDAFFLQNGFIGSFSRKKIEEVLIRLNSKNNLDESEEKNIKSIIDLVDEPILKVKLREMYARKLNQDVQAERIREQISLLQQRLNDINQQ